ncbi:hypothetical protein V6N13_104263 [Hibiscus sabdariffa]
MQITVSLLRIILSVARPRTVVLGNIPNSEIYRSMDQYPIANNVPGILILQIDAPVYFANSSYLRERISRWIYEEEDRLKSAGETSLHCVILDLSAVGSIDTSGISMLEELMKNVDRKGLQLALANPRSEVMKKLDKSKLIDKIGQGWIFLTVGEAVSAYSFILENETSFSIGDLILQFRQELRGRKLCFIAGDNTTVREYLYDSGQRSENPSFLAHLQQDKLLMLTFSSSHTVQY